VWKAPCIFLCRNTRPAHGRPIVTRAVGYGLPGVRVDGNDVLAVWQVATEAADRGRAALGATLIEAVIENVDKKDPLRRLRGYLRHLGLWSESWEQELAERHEQAITDALAAAERKPAPAIETLFDDVYEELPWHLREQRASLLHG